MFRVPTLLLFLGFAAGCAPEGIKEEPIENSEIINDFVERRSTFSGAIEIFAQYPGDYRFQTQGDVIESIEEGNQASDQIIEAAIEVISGGPVEAIRINSNNGDIKSVSFEYYSSGFVFGGAGKRIEYRPHAELPVGTAFISELESCPNKFDWNMGSEGRAMSFYAYCLIAPDWYLYVYYDD